ncbi:CRC domain [Macleaya cordata]|uniref:CRC domain n=1 Tax=Macleaya cordata TaxID=56857 RepID=A0A200QYM9_MACCD|nr:CRC domain [Macleaya cordata]
MQDSPVFNYINSLSPIKPVRSVNISQTFNSLTFASPPSVFTSPHVSNQKESRFLRRHFFSDSSKSGLSSENGNEGNTRVTTVDTVQVFNCSTDPPQSLNSGSVIREVDPPNENLELAIELSRTLKYDCDSPESNPAPCHGFETDSVLEISGTSSTLRQFVQEVPLKRCSLKNGAEAQEICQLEQTKEEEVGNDWENLISDTAGLLVFDSSNDAEACKEQDQKLLDPNTGSLVPKLPQDSTDDLLKTQPDVQVCSHENGDMENFVTQSGEGGMQKETNHTPQELPSTSQNKQGVDFPSEKMDDKTEIDCKQRGTRRRCLLFEMVGHKRSLEDNSNSRSSISHSDGKFASDDKQLVPFKAGNSSSPCMLPGIGLHLNALAATTKDTTRVVKHENLPSGRQVISMSSRLTSLHSVVSEQNPLNKTFALNSVERDMGPAVNEVQVMQDASQASGFGVREEFNESSSPRKRRRRLEPAGEEACKRCNCKKSKCLKLYCECFAAGVYCVEPCSCLDCFNKPVHEDTVLATRKQIESRNPLAFAPKVIRSAEPAFEIGEEPNKTPASARHKKGCNCKKSSCLKKYCECYQGGVGCSINCRCESCKNVFGRKDGSAPIGEEVEPEVEEPDTCEKNSVRKSLQISEVQKDKEEQYPDHVMPITPFQICRMSVQLEFSSIGKPPRPSIFPVGSSPRLQANRTLKRSETLPTPLKLEKHFQITPEDETPEILKSNSSPVSSVKTSSPNRKRVSPPHGRSTRKLVLQSIPSFPSLAYHENDDLQ